MGAGEAPDRHRRAAHRAVFQHHIDSRGIARYRDFAADDVDDCSQICRLDFVDPPVGGVLHGPRNEM